MGRRSRWEELEIPNKLELIESWCRDGATDKDIANNLGIGLTTLYGWKKTFPEIDEALKKGKEIADVRVENALYKRALGYRYKEIKTIALTSKSEIEKAQKAGLEVNRVILKQEITEKEIVPDTLAQIFWLKNRKPEIWRDRQDVKHEGNIGINIEKIHDLLNRSDDVIIPNEFEQEI